MKTKTEQQEAIERIKNLPYKEQKKYTHVSNYYILMSFFEIIKFTDRIFLTDKIKGEIFRKTELDFFEMEHKDEVGKITIGIKTFWQLEQFINHYNQQLKIFRKKILLQKASEYDQLEFSSKIELVNKDLYAYKKFNLITGGNYLTKKIAKLAKIEKEYLNAITNFSNKNLIGFTCELDLQIVKEIFNLMVIKKQISGKLTDFQAMFCNTPSEAKEPVKWLIRHGRKPNKTALFTFLKMMLELDKFPRDILRQANKLFLSGKENIFSEKYTYPNEDEQKSSRLIHFKQIKVLMKNTRPA